VWIGGSSSASSGAVALGEEVALGSSITQDGMTGLRPQARQGVQYANTARSNTSSDTADEHDRGG
jgi:hypothetical protein